MAHLVSGREEREEMGDKERKEKKGREESWEEEIVEDGIRRYRYVGPTCACMSLRESGNDHLEKSHSEFRQCSYMYVLNHNLSVHAIVSLNLFGYLHIIGGDEET